MITRLLHWLDARFPLKNTWQRYASGYWVPKNLNIYYLFGFFALLVLANQLLTGLWLTMFYTPTAAGAFDSIQYIMRDVNYGWLLRYLHSTGASAFFIVLYLHLFRGLLYGSYQKPRELVWLLGMALFVLLLAEAFFGYLLPWGQLSYWGAEVITALFGSIPLVGDSLLRWLRGDYAVGNATLQRFFALHVIGIPLLVLGVLYLHIVALHQVGSNNPEGIDIKQHRHQDGHPLDGIPLHPYYTVKDLFGGILFLMAFFAVVFFMPAMNGLFLEPLNAMEANPLVTPDEIHPLWYMAPFYAMLRVVPNKLLGIAVMLSAIGIFFLLPWLDTSPVRSMRYKGRLSKIALAGWVLSLFLLTWLGLQAVSPWLNTLAQACTVWYFGYFIIMPFYSRYERTLNVPDRIAR